MGHRDVELTRITSPLKKHGHKKPYRNGIVHTEANASKGRRKVHLTPCLQVLAVVDRASEVLVDDAQGVSGPDVGDRVTALHSQSSEWVIETTRKLIVYRPTHDT